MPNNIKAILSLVVLIVGGCMYFYEAEAGNEPLGWVAVALSMFMVLAMWVFPETGSAKGNKKN